MTRHHKKRFPAFLWHRRLGLLLVLFIIMLAITGIMLNHTDSLQLNQKKISNSLLLNFYDIKPQKPPINYRSQQHNISQWDEQIYFDQKKLLNDKQELRGLVNWQNIIVMVLSRDVVLLSTDGEIIDRYALAQNSEIEHIGIQQNHLIIKMLDQSIWQADDDILNWQPIAPIQLNWSAPSPLNLKLKQILLEKYRGEGLPLERIVLDIHSGRIFGNFGVYLMDGVALIMLFLSLSGAWMWRQRRQKQLKKKKRKA